MSLSTISPSKSRSLFGKRVFDTLLVVLSAPLWLPIFLIVAFLVRWKLGKPVFFRQSRPGLNGYVFLLFKFRTMSDSRDADGKPLSDSQRLLPFGRWLRSTSLDELPEIVNILRGEMSLVGPRPLLTQYMSRYSPEQARRHETLPGLTGWAQINGRNAISWEEKFEFDVWYVDHRSAWLDLRILLKTVKSALRREGISADGEATMPEFMGNATSTVGSSGRSASLKSVSYSTNRQDTGAPSLR